MAAVRRLIVAAVLAAGFLGTAPWIGWDAPATARAQVPATSSQAALLSALLQSRLRELAGLLAPTVQVTLDGKVEVEARGAAYRVELPALSAVLPDGSHLSVGPSQLQLSQIDPDLYRVDRLTLPQTIPWRNAAGERLGALTLGAQRFTGEWSMELGGFRSIDAAWTDVRLTGLGTGPITADSLRLQRTLTGMSMPRLDRHSEILASNMRIGDAGGPFHLVLGEAGVTIDLQGFSQEQWRRLLQPVAGGDPLAPLRALFRSMAVTANARGISLVLPGPRATVTVGSATAAVSIEEWEAAGPGRISLGYAGLKIASPEPLHGLVPAEARLSLDADPVPWAQVLAADPAAIRIRLRGEADVAGAGIALDGRLATAPAGVLGLTGTTTVYVRGFDLIMDRLARSPSSERARAIGVLLAVVQALGQGERDAAGRLVRRYDLTFGPDGRTLINGRPADAALGEAFPDGKPRPRR